MRRPFSSRAEAGRVRDGYFATPPGMPFGCFYIMGPNGRMLKIIVSDGVDPMCEGWEHVSVTHDVPRGRAPKFPPNWVEMCFVKDQFWADEETVMQFHPKQSEYVNLHPFCLHLWRKIGVDHPLPPTKLLGLK